MLGAEKRYYNPSVRADTPSLRGSLPYGKIGAAVGGIFLLFQKILYHCIESRNIFCLSLLKFPILVVWFRKYSAVFPFVQPNTSIDD